MDLTDQFEGFDELRCCTIICCADHGVAVENVSAYPQSTTAQMVRNYLDPRGAAANVFANFARSDLLVVDVGVDADLSDLDDLLDRKIARGTNNIAQGPAMTLEQAERSIDIGIELVEKAIKGGYNCFLPGEMGIANTTSSAAVAAVLLQVDPKFVTGRGTNISDERFDHKLEIVRQAIKVNRIKTKKARNPIEVLAKVGGFELGCMAGIILGAYRNDAVVILDGFNTSVAALIVYILEPDCTANLVASHIGREAGHRLVLDALDIQPVLDLDLALGEAIGSSIIARLVYNLKFAFKDAPVEEPDDELVIEASMVGDAIFDDDDDEFDDDDADDDDFGVEFNVYNGGGMDMRFNSDVREDFSIDLKRMSREHIAVTDRTFTFYLNTMPTLARAPMERAQNHLDNLSKPCRSLGLLEEIVVQIAGISGEELPSAHLGKELICFTDKIFDADEFDKNLENPEWEDHLNPLAAVSNTAEDFNVPVTFAVLDESADLSAAFDFGRSTAEDVSFKTPVIGLTTVNDADAYEDLGEDLVEALLTERGELKYNADEFLKHVPKESQSLVSAVVGAIVAAAHNSSLVVVDRGAVELIAQYVEELCPAVRPYILHAERLVLPDAEGLDDEFDGEVACIAMMIVDAALKAANDMKTFGDSGVPTAIDGIGNFRQFK